jgi:hypothetical protein
MLTIEINFEALSQVLFLIGAIAALLIGNVVMSRRVQ